MCWSEASEFGFVRVGFALQEFFELCVAGFELLWVVAVEFEDAAFSLRVLPSFVPCCDEAVVSEGFDASLLEDLSVHGEGDEELVNVLDLCCQQVFPCCVVWGC